MNFCLDEYSCNYIFAYLSVSFCKEWTVGIKVFTARSWAGHISLFYQTVTSRTVISIFNLASNSTCLLYLTSLDMAILSAFLVSLWDFACFCLQCLDYWQAWGIVFPGLRWQRNFCFAIKYLGPGLLAGRSTKISFLKLTQHRFSPWRTGLEESCPSHGVMARARRTKVSISARLWVATFLANLLASALPPIVGLLICELERPAA